MVCECISHSRSDNVKGFRMDEDFFVDEYGSAIQTADDLWTDGLKAEDFGAY